VAGGGINCAGVITRAVCTLSTRRFDPPLRAGQQASTRSRVERRNGLLGPLRWEAAGDGIRISGLPTHGRAAHAGTHGRVGYFVQAPVGVTIASSRRPGLSPISRWSGPALAGPAPSAYRV
jgi:hypothetical protein